MKRNEARECVALTGRVDDFEKSDTNAPFVANSTPQFYSTFV